MKHHSGILLPDFIGIGPPRTGTTWLHNILKDVAVLPRGTKETEFFAGRYGKGLQWYADHFRDGFGDIPVGEFDPNFFRQETIGRIHSHLPDCRLICTMRDPVDRTYSLYQHLRRMGRVRAGFEAWLPEMKDGHHYAEFLRLWQDRFGAEQILVTFFDDLVADAQSYLDRICDFIGARHVKLERRSLNPALRNHVESAPPYASPARIMSRFRRMLQGHRAYSVTKLLGRAGLWHFFFEGGAPYQPLSAEVERRTRESFRPEVEALEDLLGRDLTAWKYPRDSFDRETSKAFREQSNHREQRV